MRFSHCLITPLALALTLLPAAQAAADSCQHDLQQQRTCGKRVVEVMFVLDTTGSMAQLIAGAKKKIWSIANEVADNDPDAIVRMGLIGYRDVNDNYVTKFHDLTEDLDGLYGNLLGFQANGGGDRPESVNQALYESVTRASWTTHGERNIRLVFLAGDSPPHMDYRHDVKYPETMSMARKRGITVHALQAGRHQDTQAIWQRIAEQGGGVYAQIPQSGNVQVTITPYDDQIQELQQQLDGTLIPYGRQSLRHKYRDKVKNRMSAGAQSTADRATFRAKQNGKREVITGGGDLIAEIEAGTIDADKLEPDLMPENLRKLTPAQRMAKITESRLRRQKIDDELNGLIKKREGYLKKNEKRRADSFDEQVRHGVRMAF